jgi:hypothetical protein
MNRSAENDQSLGTNAVPNQARNIGREVFPTPEKTNEQPEEIRNAGMLTLVPHKKDGKRPEMSVEKKGKRLTERERHREAFALYFALGPERTLGAVSRQMGIKESLVQNWSSGFGWKERILELESRSQEEIFKEKAIAILNLILDSLAKRDQTGRLALVSSERAAVEKLKHAVDSFKRLREDTREDEDHQKSMEPGGQVGSRSPRGVMVNVIIKK